MRHLRTQANLRAGPLYGGLPNRTNPGPYRDRWHALPLTWRCCWKQSPAPDGLDPRQKAGLSEQAYTQALTGDVTGLRLGIVREGFNLEESESDVDEAVEKAARSFESMGALVETVSIPWHLDGIHLWRAIAVEGATMLMIAGNSMGTNWKGHYTTGLQDIFAHGWQSRADDLSETTKLVVLMGQYMQDRYHGHYYSKAQNLARMLTAAYDQALSEYDLLVMPTLPMKATVIPHAPIAAARSTPTGRWK